MQYQKPDKAKVNGLVASLESACLTLVAILPLLVPFSVGMTIDLQGLVVILTGVLAATALLVRQRKQAWQLPRYGLILLGLYILSCGLALATQHTFVNFFGSWLVRLGAPALVASVCCGLALCAIETKRLVTWLYSSCLVLAITAIPSSVTAFRLSVRAGGVFHQADFLAVFMAAGLLLGVSMWQLYPRFHKPLIVGQVLMTAILLLTETRAVIAFLIVIGVVIILRSGLSWRRRVGWSFLAALLVLTVALGSQAILARRLTDSTYANQSVQYRLALQSFGLKATTQQPLFGYGPGSLSTPLACSTLHNPDLQLTCHQGYYFDSSHNVFLDRVLALGWLGGVSFCLFVILALYRGWRATGIERYLAYIALLIAAYYFTNPTDLEIELLFWVVLLRPFRKTSHASA